MHGKGSNRKIELLKMTVVIIALYSDAFLN